jgi:hypothetical protein
MVDQTDWAVAFDRGGAYQDDAGVGEITRRHRASFARVRMCPVTIVRESPSDGILPRDHRGRDDDAG